MKFFYQKIELWVQKEIIGRNKKDAYLKETVFVGV